MKAGVDYPSWTTLFPKGRYIYYEGNTPDEFIAEVKARFGFDPVKNKPNWQQEYKDWGCFGFFCPPEHLDAIYGNNEYPMGS